jgi:hypothetical protein
VRVVQGAASKRVAAIEVEQAGRKWDLPIDSACGAFVVGIEAPEPAIVRAIGPDGHVLHSADGSPEETDAELQAIMRRLMRRPADAG